MHCFLFFKFFAFKILRLEKITQHNLFKFDHNNCNHVICDKNLKGGNMMGKVYVLKEAAEKHSRNFLLFTIVIFGSVFGLAACNNDANDETPMENNNDAGINENGTYNGQEGDGVIDGVDTNNQNDFDGNVNDTKNNNTNDNINEGTPSNNDSFKDEAENVIDDTEDAIRGEDGNKTP